MVSAPTGTDPDPDIAAITPMPMHPNHPGPRPVGPMASIPDPTTSPPFPAPADPNKSWIWGACYHFDLGRRWCRGIHDRLVGRRGSGWRLHINRAVAINDLAFHAPGQPGHDRRNYKSFEQK